MKKQIKIKVNNEIKEYLKNKDIPLWISKQSKKYQKNKKLQTIKIPYQPKTTLYLKLNNTQYQTLKNIEGSSNSKKITNLYYHMLQQEKKKKHRIMVYNKYFKK